MEWNSKNQIALASSVSFAVIIALLILPVFAGKDTIFLVNGNNATPEPCNGNTGLVLAQNLTDLCDVTIISPITSQILQYNGSQWVNVAQTVFNDTTQCINVGSGTAYACVEGTNINLRSLLGSTGISINNNTNTINITNTLPENTSCTSTDLAGADGNLCYGGNVELKSLLVDGGLTISNSCGGQCLLIVNSAPESTVCTNDGHGSGNVCNGGNVHLKGIASGTGITVTQNGTDIIITNSAVDTDITYLNKNTVGTNFQIFKNSTAVGSTTTNYFRTIVNSTGLSFTNDTNTITEKTNFANGTGINITGTGKQTFTNTGVISNSCTSPLSCSGTNPSSISCPSCRITNNVTDWELLCNTSGTGDISCSSFASRTFLHVEISYVISSSGTAAAPDIRFNSNSSAVYGWRTAINGAADTTASSTNQCRLTGGTVGNNGGGSTVLDIVNISTLRKIAYYHSANGFDSSSATLPVRVEGACKWDNNTVAITTINLVRDTGTATFVTGTQISVWGHN